MKNIAKCKLCNTIIESFHSSDYVSCSCGEIAVDGGQALRCAARDFANFVRVDDEGNEIVVHIQDNKNSLDMVEKITKQDLIKRIDFMISGIEGMPPNALSTPLNHYDLVSVLALISAILKAD